MAARRKSLDASGPPSPTRPSAASPGGAGAGATFEGETDDLATLSRLDEQVLVDQLRRRYDADKIYTYIGDILVAVNPFRPLEIYTRKQQLLYRNRTKHDAPPHIFAVADAAYHNLMDSKRDQCCVVSGESGAGKTESAKLIIKQIVELCQTGASGMTLEKKILDVNPLLEAFGNAQTTMNDNSSRFGKYTEMLFDEQGHVLGARISEYLLEKSRVVGQQEGEQNFHIFYYLFATPTPEKYFLDAPESYRYLSNIDGVDVDVDAMYEEVIRALHDLGFADKEREEVLKILAAIVHIGNINFDSSSALDPVRISKDSDKEISAVCQLLDIAEQDLRNALCFTVMYMKDENVRRQYNKGQATDTRDAVAKALYGRLFGWIVAQINVLLSPQQASKAKKVRTGPGGAEPKTGIIGILDIFGFEHFAENRFEQWCINIANEQLQHFFNQHVFQLELEEYAKEGVDGANISYVDNKPLLEMHLAKPIGLLALLDEESLFPQATDSTCVAKFKKNFVGHVSFQPCQSEDSVFTIIHYAGKVTYSAQGMVDKNRDSLASDIIMLMQGSGCELVSSLFLGSVNSLGMFELGTKAESKGATPRTPHTPRSVDPKNATGRRHPTVSTQFKNSLSVLVEKMTACRPHFVRCIKPNTEKSPWNFVDAFVEVQLNYTGMLETTRIRREGYAVRPKFEEFIERFKLLRWKNTASVPPTLDSCKTILTYSRIQGWLPGKTKIFLKYYHVEELETLVALHHKFGTLFQSCARGMVARRRHAPLLKAAREQRQMAQGMFEKLYALSSNLKLKLQKLTQEDVARHKERSLQEKEELRRQAQRRLQEEAERLEQEKRRTEEIAVKLEAAKKEKEEREKELREEKERFLKSKEELIKMQQSIEKARQQNEEVLAKARAESEERTRALKDTLGQRERAVEDLETKVASLQEQVQRQTGDHERIVRLNKEALQTADNEIMELRRKVQQLEAMLETARAESAGIVAELKRLLAEKDTVAEKRRIEHERAIMELETRLSSSQEALKRKQAEHEDDLAQVQHELKQKVMLLHAAEKEKETVVRELTSKVERGEAEAEAQLRMKLREQELKLDETAAERERLSARLVSQNSLIELQKNETSHMVAELKRLMVEKDDLMQRRAADHEKAMKELEGANRGLQQTLDGIRSEHGDSTAALSVQLQQKNKHLLETQAELEDADRQRKQLAEKLENAEAEFASKRKAFHAQKLELEDAQTEVVHLRDRVANFTAQMETSRLQQEKVVSQLNEVLREKQDIIESQRTKYDQDVRAAEAKLAAAMTTIDTNNADYKRELAALQSELRGLQDSSQKDARASEEQQERLQRQLEEALAQVNALQAQVDEQTQALLAATTELVQSRQQLDNLEAAEREARSAKEEMEQKEKERLENQQRAAASMREAGDLKKMKEAISAMARRRTPNAEDKNVDLQKFISAAMGGTVLEGVTIGRLTFKGDLEKPFAGMSQTSWKKMWTVVDLQTKTMTFYTDKREFKSHVKGSIALLDITKVTLPDTKEAQDTFSFLLTTGKRVTHVRALTRQHMDAWIQILAAITGS